MNPSGLIKSLVDIKENSGSLGLQKRVKMHYKFIIRSTSGDIHWGELTAKDSDEANKILKKWYEDNHWELFELKIYPITNEEFFIERV